jgi:hypothetical protein
MKRDSKPFLYVVVFGLERFPNEKALLMGFKDRQGKIWGQVIYYLLTFKMMLIDKREFRIIIS